MNIKKIINAKLANMDILKQKMKNAYIAGRNNMEVLHALSVDMKKMKMAEKPKILYAKNAIVVIPTMIIIILFMI